jgi:hypothetical protein
MLFESSSIDPGTHVYKLQSCSEDCNVQTTNNDNISSNAKQRVSYNLTVNVLTPLRINHYLRYKDPQRRAKWTSLTNCGRPVLSRISSYD